MENILVNLTESELEDIIFCLDARANNADDEEYWEQYRRLADKLKKKMVDK